MVDAENLRFRKHAADFGIDLSCAGEVAAERLFEHDAGARRRQSAGGKVVADLCEQAGRRRQVKHADDLVIRHFRAHCFDQCPVGHGIVRIQRNVLNARTKRVPHRIVEFRHMRLRILLDLFQELVAVPAMPANADDARRRGQVVQAVSVVQCGQQLAHRQVAAAAE